MSKSILEQADILGQAFNSVITKKFGSKRAPEPLFFSTGVKHLDSLLGGGIISSGPVMVTSTPETGLIGL
jgi:RecA/RadA recombinase